MRREGYLYKSYGIVYKIECVPVKRCYVGISSRARVREDLDPTTVNMKFEYVSRLYGHLQQLKKGDHPCLLMQQDFNEHGEDSFSVSVLEWVVDPRPDRYHRKEFIKVLMQKEVWWQDKLAPEYSKDFKNRLGQYVLEQVGFMAMVDIYQGRSQVIANDELQAIKDRLQWLEQRLSAVEKRTKD